jgi:tetratricopeptide (TPR) repeat protein
MALAKNMTVVSVVVAFLGVTILSIATSSSIKTSLFGMFTTWENGFTTQLLLIILSIAWFVFFYTAKQLSLAKVVFETLMTLLVIITIGYGLGEYYLWNNSVTYTSFNVERISLGFKQSLFAAYFIGMLWSFTAAKLLAAFIALGKEEKAKKGAIALSIGMLLLFAGISFTLLITFTRSAWIAAACSLVCIVVMSLIKKETTKEYWLALFISLVIVFVQVYSFRDTIEQRNGDIPVDSQQTLQSIASTIGKTDSAEAMSFYQNAASYSSAQIRVLEWKWGLRTWSGNWKNILVGIGPDTAFFEMPKYRDPVFNEIPSDAAVKPFYVRNLYINFLLERGIIAALLVIIIAILVVSKFARSETLRARLSIPALAVAIGFATQGIFYYPTLMTSVLLCFTLAYILVEVLPEHVAIISAPTQTEKVLLIIIGIGLSLWIFPLAKAEYILSFYKQAATPYPEATMQEYSTTAINNNVLKRYLVYHYPENSTAKIYLEALSVSNDLDDLRIASDAHYLLARRFNSIDSAKKSIEALQRLATIDGTLPTTWDGLGLRYLYIRDFTNAQKSFEKAMELKPDYWYSYMHMGELSRQICQPKVALEWYKKAEQFIPTAELEIAEANEEIKNPLPQCSK